MDISNKASGEIRIAYTYSVSFQVSVIFIFSITQKLILNSYYLN